VKELNINDKRKENKRAHTLSVCVCVGLYTREIKKPNNREGSTTTTTGGTAFFFLYLKNKLETKGHFGLLYYSERVMSLSLLFLRMPHWRIGTLLFGLLTNTQRKESHS
jgi:hypothetical protein